MDKTRTRIIVGVIADDFTGASDAASFLKKGGLKTVLTNGVPSKLIKDFEAIVIALKTRSSSTKYATTKALEAYKYIKKLDAQIIYIKYGSTFDSTKSGNIGPICDTILDFSDEQYTILCPSLPINGRTVKNGTLYVNKIPLSNTSMRNHPLNPMWDSNIKKLMEPQSKYKVYLENEITQDDKYYLVPDYETDRDARNILRKYNKLTIMTGASGLLEFIAEKYSENNYTHTKENSIKNPKTLIMVGSLSRTTTLQIHYYKSLNLPSIELSARMIDKQSQLIKSILNQDIFLIYSSRSEKNRELDYKTIEQYYSKLAKLAIKNGFNQLVIAGGETSGAVIESLNISQFEILGSISPGVPLLRPLNKPELNFILKSGNFGDELFFANFK